MTRFSHSATSGLTLSRALAKAVKMARPLYYNISLKSKTQPRMMNACGLLVESAAINRGTNARTNKATLGFGTYDEQRQVVDAVHDRRP